MADSRFRIRQYDDSLSDEWQEVWSDSDSPMILKREYIEYHKDRFTDFSLVVYDGCQPVAILPAHREGDEVYSHLGLTYGGWVIRRGLNPASFKTVVSETLDYLRRQQVSVLMVRAIPSFYHRIASQYHMESIYRQVGSKVTQQFQHFCIPLTGQVSDRGKKWGYRKAINNRLTVKEMDGLDVFWGEVLIPNLESRHRVQPTHRLEEMEDLKSRLREHIRCLGVFDERNRLLAGTVLYVSDKVVHAQYISSTPEGRQLRALDYLMVELIEKRLVGRHFFSLGVSHDPGTMLMNEGLAYWKRSLGAEIFEVGVHRFDL